MRKESVGILGILLVLAPFASAGLFDWIPGLSPSDTTDVTVQVGNVAPTITSVETIPTVNLLAGTTVDVVFDFTVSDANGASDILDATAQAQVSRAGEQTRTGSCVVASQTTNEKTFECTVQMQYYDDNGLWDREVTVEDTAGATATDPSTTITVALLRDITVSPATITFPTLAPGITNSLASSITTITNNGNFEAPADGSVSITGFDLIGQTTPSETIPAANFRSAGISGALTVCTTGTSLVHMVQTALTSATLSRGATGNSEDLTHCLTLVPTGLSSQAYTANGGQAWIIGI